MKTYKIYVIINGINGKIYIGRTIRTLKERLSGHFCGAKQGKTSYFLRAIRKYGKENFKIFLVETNSTLEENKIRERYFINLFESDKKEIGYNLENGKWENQKRGYNKDYIRLRSVRFQRKPPLSSQYKGVKFSKKHNKYMSNFGKTLENGKRKLYSRLFDTLDEALIFYDRLAIFFYGNKAYVNLEKNRNYYINNNTSLKKLLKNNKKTTKYRGIEKLKNGNYKITICFNKERYGAGTFNKLNDAIEQYDKIMLLLYKNTEKLNKPQNLNKYISQETETKILWEKIADPNRIYFMNNSSGYRGVYRYNGKKQRKVWVASMRIENKKWCQYFLTKEEAAVAYDRQAIKVFGERAITNFPKENYLPK